MIVVVVKPRDQFVDRIYVINISLFHIDRQVSTLYDGFRLHHLSIEPYNKFQVPTEFQLLSLKPPASVLAPIYDYDLDL